MHLNRLEISKSTEIHRYRRRSNGWRNLPDGAIDITSSPTFFGRFKLTRRRLQSERLHCRSFHRCGSFNLTNSILPLLITYTSLSSPNRRYSKRTPHLWTIGTVPKMRSAQHVRPVRHLPAFSKRWLANIRANYHWTIYSSNRCRSFQSNFYLFSYGQN